LSFLLKSSSLLAFFIFGVMEVALGQARPAAIRSASVSVFAAGAYVKPGFGEPGQIGYMFGGDYTPYFSNFYLKPSLEVRGSISPTGGSVGENMFGGGLRVGHRYSRFTPYADLLIGSGTLKYATPRAKPGGGFANSNNSLVYTYGGGLDISILSSVAAKIDVQGSHWDTNPDFSQVFHPGWLSFGVVYTFFGAR
jgi:hypothetical protein